MTLIDKIKELVDTVQIRSLTARLNYFGIRGGVMFNRDGHHELALKFSLPPTAMVNDTTAALLRDSMQRALVQTIPAGCRGRLYVECSPMNSADLLESPFDAQTENDLLKLIVETDHDFREQRRLAGKLSRWMFVYTVRMPKRRRPRDTSFSSQEMKALLTEAEMLRTSLVSQLNAAGFRAEAMQNQELCEFVWRYLNPGLASSAPSTFVTAFFPPDQSLSEVRKDATLHTPTLRRQLAESDLDPARLDYLVVGDKLVSTINMLQVGGSKPNLSAQLLNRLSGTHFYYVLDFDHKDQQAERKALNNQAQKAAVAATDPSFGSPDPGNVASYQALAQTLQAINQDDEKIFTFAITVILIADDRQEMQRLKEIARSELSNMGGALGKAGTVQNLTQYVDRLPPAMGADNPFAFKCLSETFANMIPLTGPWQGSASPFKVYENRWGSLTGMNPSDGTSNYGTVIVGESGSGKTMLNLDRATALAYYGARLFIVDPTEAYLSFMTAIGAQVIDFRPGATLPSGEPVRFNIFESPKMPDDATGDERDSLLSNHKSLVMAFLGNLRVDSFSQDERSVINEAINASYSIAEQNGTVVTLGSFIKALKNLTRIGSEPITRKDIELAARLATSMQEFTSGAWGRFLNGESTVSIDGEHVLFNIKALMDNEQLRRIGFLMTTRAIWQAGLTDRVRPKVPVFEEARVLFEMPEAIPMVVTLFSTGRTYRFYPHAISQQLSDFPDAIINNSTEFMIGKVGTEQASYVSERLSLGDAAYDALMGLKQLKGSYSEYLAVRRTGDHQACDVITFRPNKPAYWTFTSDGLEQERRFALTEQYGGSVIHAVRSLAGLNIQ